jgi:RimJ/RimL family protein N-acetyltransferase
MTQTRSIIQTSRLRLRPWCEDHRSAFAEMHADREVMADQGGPIDRAESDAKFDRYVAAYLEHGTSRWAVEDAEGSFLGYAGVMPRPASNHPLGPHYEIGWRFVRSAWGRGFATESAGAALLYAFQHLSLDEILSYTSADNQRSQAVMARINLERAPLRDFVAEYGSAGPWRGLVWVASRTRWTAMA